MTATDMLIVYMRVNINDSISIPNLYSSFQVLPATHVVVTVATSNWGENVWKSETSKFLDTF